MHKKKETIPKDKQPSWLKNATVRKQRSTKSPKKEVTKKTVASVLKEAGLTLVLDDNDKSQVVDAIIDPDEDHDMMKSWAEGRMLTLAGRALRDRFVIEFLKDFNGTAAATRCGSADPYNLWRRMRRCAYTQRAISAKLEDWEASAIVTRDKLCACLWREANDFEFGSSASRVMAAAKLGKLLGYEVDIIGHANLNDLAKFIESPLSKDEAIEVQEVFDDEY